MNRRSFIRGTISVMAVAAILKGRVAEVEHRASMYFVGHDLGRPDGDWTVIAMARQQGKTYHVRLMNQLIDNIALASKPRGNHEFSKSANR